MRPTPREELEGIRRILADVVAPAVTAEYPATVLQQILTALDRLSASWERAGPLLAAENASLRELLPRLASLLPGVEVVDSSAGTAAASLDFAALDEENQRLRRALDAAVRALDSGAVEDATAVENARVLIGATLRANLDRALNP
jgi:hypothetical protein